MKDNDEMLHLLRHLPMPFVLSGKDGAVLFINEQALENAGEQRVLTIFASSKDQ